MGFITGNTNSFEVFLTDYGLQTFYRDGLKDDSIYFSAIDDDANYLQLAKDYDPVNVFNNPRNTIRSIRVPQSVSGGTIVTDVTTITGETVTTTTTTVITTGATPPSGNGGTPQTAVKRNSEQWNNGGARLYVGGGYPHNGDVTLDVALIEPHLWVNGNFQWDNAGRNQVDGRMNVAGVWADNVPANEYIGFSRRIDLAVSKTVYIGMSADNAFRFMVNGNPLVDCTSGNIQGGPNFNFFHIYPVTLNEGANWIEMWATDFGTPAGMAAEIYDMTRDELIAAQTEADLQILFSTRDMVGQPFDLGQTAGWSCPSGWSLDTSGSGDPVCARNETTTTETYVTGYTTTTGVTVTQGDGSTVNGQSNVWTQTNKRGAVLDGKYLKKPLLKCNEDTFKNFLVYEGDSTTDQDYSLLTYRKINGVKQFNLKGLNGLYLKYAESAVGPEKRIYDIDAYPQSAVDPEFTYVNARYNKVGDIKYHSGSNDTKTLNKTVAYSQITRSGYLILNEKYDIEFDFRFRFFMPNYATVNANERYLNVNLYAILGRNKIPMTIYTPGTDPDTAPGTNVLYLDNTQVDANVATIGTDVHGNSQIQIKDVIKMMENGVDVEREVYVSCRIKAGMAKKSKDLSILVDYNGRYGGSSTITVVDVTGGGAAGGGDVVGDPGLPEPDTHETCLLEGTLIELASGEFKPVEQLLVGEALKSVNIFGLSANREDKAYLNAWSTDTLNYEAAVTYVKGFALRRIEGMYRFNGRLSTSPTHIHLVHDGTAYRYKRSDKIRVGESLVKVDGSLEKIFDIELISGIFNMYQVDTEMYENFFAGGYITHNKHLPGFEEAPDYYDSPRLS